MKGIDIGDAVITGALFYITDRLVARKTPEEMVKECNDWIDVCKGLKLLKNSSTP